jgi:hypothetical protein
MRCSIVLASLCGCHFCKAEDGTHATNSLSVKANMGMILGTSIVRQRAEKKSLEDWGPSVEKC